MSSDSRPSSGWRTVHRFLQGIGRALPGVAQGAGWVLAAIVPAACAVVILFLVGSGKAFSVRGMGTLALASGVGLAWMKGVLLRGDGRSRE